MIKMFFSQSSLLFLSSLITFFYLILSSNVAAQLPTSEVQALRDIAKALGKTNWNFDVDPCSGELGWFTKNPIKGFDNAVSCNCSFSNATVCHVTSIVLKGQSHPGTLPNDLGKLPFLQELDLTRNYLNGTIPPEWGSSQLVNISLLGNRLTGSIPKELGNITTLKSLVLEINQLSGIIPPELGNLTSIERFFVTSNNLTGKLPETLEKLTTLTDFRIGDNRFSGAIPSFIQKWTKLERLVIQGSGLSGPIPSSISALEKLTDLRISDLSGPGAIFPPLNNITKIEILILRNCSINGTIPDYLGKMASLETLDLSFNKLTGNVPGSLASLSHLKYIFLTGNLLSGEVADWLLKRKKSTDLSYNNFTDKTSTCQQGSVNLFASSSQGNNSRIVSCLRNFTCPKNWYSLHINCGGNEVPVDDTTFEADTNSARPSFWFQSETNWAFSSTGYFLDNSSTEDSYITGNSSTLTMENPELYMNARLSPISLTYYAFCLANGNYTVKLHFVEIMFTNDKTYGSLGRRLFDVYIQGRLVLQNFNIEDEAGGAGKAIVKNFTVSVTSGTLEIRFYWAGKGTIAIPYKGVYGPLISAISVKSDFKPPSSSISVGAVIGIIAGSLLIVSLIIGVLWWTFCLRRKNLKGVDLKTGKFTLRQIKAATNNFDVANKIGEGGFGSVYKGLLSDGTIIAVKQLSSKSKQGNREFLNEIGMISAVQHPHLVKLYGCCIEGDQLLLVYEYMENNNIARALFGPEECQINLDWPTRRKICIGIARGLAYLHEESRLKIVHRDIKATNVLLDKDLNPKISDFGLAKLDDEENTHISTRIAGTYGYMAPEYAMRGYLTDKADVYSYGIVILEIISGKSNTTSRAKDDSFYLLDWALMLKEKGDLMELVDPRLGSDYDREEVLLTIKVALLCTNVSAAARPTMSSVVSILEGKTAIQEIMIDDTSVSKDEITARRKHHQLIQEGNQADSQTHSMSIEGPWTGSSSSVHDLYPVNPDSDYLQSRN